MNTNRQFQCGSDWIGDQHRRLQPDAQTQTGAIPQRQTCLTGLQPELSGDFCFLSGKRQNFHTQSFHVFTHVINSDARRYRFLHYFRSVDAGNNGFGQNRFHLIAAGFILQKTQQSGGTKHDGHSFASRFAALCRSAINSSVRLVVGGSRAKRFLSHCLIVLAFSRIRRPSSMRAINCSPDANPSECLCGTEITNRPWESRWTSIWVSDFGMALNFVARKESYIKKLIYG